ncbi:MAG: hypothetical protein QNK05_14655 [Myxococcota bacterium]|nr:hypothetical protein [Myxococcota bacterium]
MPTALYTIGLASLFTHEMDAVMAAEWRLLFGLRSLPDATAYPIFLVLHLPLFAVMLWLGHHPRERVRSLFRAGVAAFLVIHGALHWRLAGAPENGFEGLLSYGFIALASLCGGLYLLGARETLRAPRA